EHTVQVMADDSYAFNSSQNKLHIQLRQRLLSWSNHVKSWVDESNLPVLAIRYEDMKSDPFNTFSKAIDFIGICKSEQSIRRAIQFSDFKEIQKQEVEKGFKEKPAKVKTFFRKGIAGAWKDEMPEDLVKQICTDHAEIMKRFGYLDDSGKPI
ncbi:MAG: sulfotransferase domain-containing protein, partial [Bacteroidales bacterium]